jgi:hypothetical protein
MRFVGANPYEVEMTGCQKTIPIEMGVMHEAIW